MDQVLKNMQQDFFFYRAKLFRVLKLVVNTLNSIVAWGLSVLSSS